MLSRKPSGPGLRVDVTLTRASHLNTDIEQSISERLATKRFGGKKCYFQTNGSLKCLNQKEDNNSLMHNDIN